MPLGELHGMTADTLRSGTGWSTGTLARTAFWWSSDLLRIVLIRVALAG